MLIRKPFLSRLERIKLGESHESIPLKAQREPHLTDKIPAHRTIAVALVWRQVTVIMVCSFRVCSEELTFSEPGLDYQSEDCQALNRNFSRSL
jgi:hypothetical protein